VPPLIHTRLRIWRHIPVILVWRQDKNKRAPRPPLTHTVPNVQRKTYKRHDITAASGADRDHILVASWIEHISRMQYESIYEIIMMTLDNTDPIKTLPKSLSTLRKNFLGKFSCLPLRRVKVPVVSSKLPTLSPLEKNLAASLPSSPLTRIDHNYDQILNVLSY
jgi:hypothetical protein